MASDADIETAPDNAAVGLPKDRPTTLGVAPVALAENAAQGEGDAVEAATPEPAKTHDSPMKKPNRRSEEGLKERRPRKVCNSVLAMDCPVFLFTLLTLYVPFV